MIVIDIMTEGIDIISGYELRQWYLNIFTLLHDVKLVWMWRGKDSKKL